MEQPQALAVPAPESLEPSEPVVPELAKVEEKPAPAKEQRVGLEVFASVGGHKWDQLAGFVRHAERQKIGPRSVTQWREELRKFNDRPVR